MKHFLIIAFTALTFASCAYLVPKPSASDFALVAYNVETLADEAACEKLQSAIKELPGVTAATVNYLSQRIAVAYTPSKVNPERIEATLNDNTDAKITFHPFKKKEGSKCPF